VIDDTRFRSTFAVTATPIETAVSEVAQAALAMYRRAA
jgi:hypothetical protein